MKDSSPVFYFLDAEWTHENEGVESLDERKMGDFTEVAVALQSGEIFPFAIKPKTPGLRMKGLTDEEHASARPFPEVAKDLMAAIRFDPTQDTEDAPIWVAHNAWQDMRRFRERGTAFGDVFLNVLCTWDLVKAIQKSDREFPQSLEKLCKHFNIPFEQKHRAGPDAEALVKVLAKLLESDVPEVSAAVLSAVERAYVPASIKAMPRGPGILLGPKLTTAYDLGEEAYRHWISSKFGPETEMIFEEHPSFLSATHAFIQSLPRERAKEDPTIKKTVVEHEGTRLEILSAGTYSLNGDEYSYDFKRGTWALKRLIRYYENDSI